MLHQQPQLYNNKYQSSQSHHNFQLPDGKNGINGTQRTEQSEVYGTKKEEKREKRRKLV